MIYTYACIGKVAGHELFSFNLLAREHIYEAAEITQKINELDPNVTA